jgi:hypothetical protein
MLDRAEALARLAARFRSGNSDPKAEKARIGFLVEDTAGLPLDVLQSAIRKGVTVWRFMPTAAEIFEQAQDDLNHARDMAKLRTERQALPALPKPSLPAMPVDIAKRNEWGKSLGLQWDENGNMTRTPVAKPVAFEDKKPPSMTPQADDYAAIKAELAAKVPAVSDVSPALRSLREKIMGEA